MHSCCKVIFRFSNLASWIPNLTAILLWPRQCVCSVERFLTISFHCWCHWKWRVSESRGWLQPFWGNSLPRSLSSPASPLPVIYVPCCPDRNTNTQRPGSRLQINAHCVCVCPVLGDRGNKQHSHTCWAGSQSMCRDAAEENDIQESAVKADSE